MCIHLDIGFLKKLNQLIVFDEIYLIVSSPDEGRIRVVRDSGEPILDVFRITSNGLLVDKLPILVAPEQVGGPGLSPGEPGLDIIRQPRPVRGYLPGITRSNSLGGQLPVIVLSREPRIVIPG